MKWFVYTRGTIHLHRAAQLLLGVHEFATKLNGIKFEKILYINEGLKFWWGWDNKEIRNLGAKILKKCSTKKNQSKHFQKLKFYAEQAIAAAEKIRKTNLVKNSNQHLVKLYDVLYKKAGPAHSLMDVDIDAIDVVFEDFLQNKIKNELKDKISDSEFLNLYQKISIPFYETFLAKQEKESMKLALKKKTGAKDIRKVYDKFWWTKLGWENMVPYKKADFAKLIKIYSKSRNLESKLEKAKSRLNKIKKQRQFLIKKYNLSKEIGYWLRFLDKYVYFHDLRKEMQVKSTYSFYLLMSESARRLKLKKDDLEWLWYDEVKDLLRGKKLDNEEVKKENRRFA